MTKGPFGRCSETWIASGGTVKALARLIAADAQRPKLSVHGVSVTGRQLRRVSDHLMRLRRSERARLPGVGRHRVDAIATGAEVLSTLTEVMGAHSLTVSEWGLRDGIILEALGLTETPSVGPWDRGALARSR
jgi:exopolyphosphatase / guanosine-5'-triphosphate,3'-diphosphate pyrophosphatase